MNYPSRTDSDGRAGWNQNPNALESSTRAELNGMANDKMLLRSDIETPIELVPPNLNNPTTEADRMKGKGGVATEIKSVAMSLTDQSLNSRSHVALSEALGNGNGHHGSSHGRSDGGGSFLTRVKDVLVTFGKFVGPGFMISVAYIDPGNYSTDVAAGASYEFRLLFVVLMSNIIAIYLQSLCIKLGTVSGMDLAQMCRAHLPKWLNIFLYFMAEAAIIATDIAEVIGTAIAINLLIPKIPLVAGCAISIIDVLLILIFYRPNGSMKGLRAFEFFVMALVLGVVVCFIIQLTLIQDTSVGQVFKGYLPSSALVEQNGLYQACGILGATVMPHSLYLGSGIVQPRLHEYDVKNGYYVPRTQQQREEAGRDEPGKQYLPSLPAINFCLKFSIIEVAVSLFTFALFVNSAILIVAGASLYQVDGAADADLFSIYHLLADSISPAAGTIFALALLLSGISAGIVCTIAGQMVSEGALNWSIAPWLRRLVTRSISITPSIIIAGAVGGTGLSKALNGTQVALSVALPFISAPIIYFTARDKFMTVKDARNVTVYEDEQEDNDSMLMMPEGTGEVGSNDASGVSMRNAWYTTAIAVAIWVLVAAMNVANLVLLGFDNGN